MKRISFTFFALFFIANTFGQHISVSSFKLLDTDLTANTSGTIEMDQNGETAALIKVVTTQTGFTFDGGALGIVKTLQKPSEIWVYVPHGLKKITISHPQLGILRDYYLNIPIEAAKTYEMILISGEIKTIVKESLQSQYLVFRVSPSNAVIELNGEILSNNKGIAQKFVKFGTYEYRIFAHNYHTAAGKVTIDNDKEKKLLDINLEPAFGWIEITTSEELDGAQVFIDNEPIGVAPLKSESIASGMHNLRIAKSLYQTYEENVLIEDGKILSLRPSLVADYSIVKLSVDNNADLYINDEYKGRGSWIGKLGSGIYVFEAKKKNHIPTKTTVEINNIQKEQSINLQAPTPIYGKLNITSDPLMADVILDEILVGQTPLYLSDCLVGEHKLEIKYKDYESYSSTIFVKESENNEINITLSTELKVTFNSNVSSPTIYINNENYGTVGTPIFLTPGKYSVKMTKDGYEDCIKDIVINSKHKVFNFDLKKIVKKEEKPQKEIISWEQVRITTSQSDVYNRLYVGDVTQKYGIGGAFPSLVEKNYQRCINRMKKKAAKLGGSIILLGTPYEVHPLGGNFMKIPATAYK